MSEIEIFKEKYWGRIVALDDDEIVGIGDSILEAYNDAITRSKKEQFDFKRIGLNITHGELHFHP